MRTSNAFEDPYFQFEYYNINPCTFGYIFGVFDESNIYVSKNISEVWDVFEHGGCIDFMPRDTSFEGLLRIYH